MKPAGDGAAVFEKKVYIMFVQGRDPGLMILAGRLTTVWLSAKFPKERLLLIMGLNRAVLLPAVNEQKDYLCGIRSVRV